MPQTNQIFKEESMSVKYSLFKTTADGEQLNIEICPTNQELEQLRRGVSARALYDVHFRVADDRMREMNIRILLAQTALKNYPPEVQVAFHNVMAVLHGAKPTDPAYEKLLLEAIQQTTEKLIASGVPSEQVAESVKHSYGNLVELAQPPQDEVQIERGTE
jgi:hypothetical protein